jgi:hypothetical protein
VAAASRGSFGNLEKPTTDHHGVQKREQRIISALHELMKEIG